MSLTKVLDERGKQYGKFETHAAITQGLKFWIPRTGLQPDQREALEMIMHKIARIINGNPNNIDSWMDIAGYATLVAERLKNDGNNEVLDVSKMVATCNS